MEGFLPRKTNGQSAGTNHNADSSLHISSIQQFPLKLLGIDFGFGLGAKWLGLHGRVGANRFVGARAAAECLPHRILGWWLHDWGGRLWLILFLILLVGPRLGLALVGPLRAGGLVSDLVQYDNNHNANCRQEERANDFDHLVRDSHVVGSQPPKTFQAQPTAGHSDSDLCRGHAALVATSGNPVSVCCVVVHNFLQIRQNHQSTTHPCAAASQFQHVPIAA
mmetsp:Transcript_83089/g.173936  ORF Transcript_83089/g.173936 Transcript_83089/m.173936 type:complete len:222 (+) Transcript_83089:419-1084(+)